MWRLREKRKKIIEELEVEKRELLATIAHLNSEIKTFNYKLDQMSRSIRMLNNGTDSLEKIIELGQEGGNRYGLGFINKTEPNLGWKKSEPETLFVNQMSAPMSR